MNFISLFSQIAIKYGLSLNKKIFESDTTIVYEDDEILNKQDGIIVFYTKGCTDFLRKCRDIQEVECVLKNISNGIFEY